MNDFIEMFPMFMVCFLVIVIIAIFASHIVTNADNKKPLQERTVTIKQKLVEGGPSECYLVECENGERMRLVNYKADKLILVVGDTGIVKYRGRTIQSFQRI